MVYLFTWKLVDETHSFTFYCAETCWCTNNVWKHKYCCPHFCCALRSIFFVLLERPPILSVLASFHCGKCMVKKCCNYVLAIYIFKWQRKINVFIICKDHTSKVMDTIPISNAWKCSAIPQHAGCTAPVA